MNLKHTLLTSGAFGGMTASERRLGRFIRDGEGHPAPTPAPVEPAGQDAFDAAFAENAAEALPAGETPPTAETPPAGVAAPTGETPPTGETLPAAETPADGEASPASAAPASPTEGAQTADDVLRGLADILKNNQQAPSPAAPQSETPEQPFYTAEETEILTEFEKNWPDVHKAQMLQRRGEYSDLIRYIFTGVVDYVKPLLEQQKVIGNTLHQQELISKVPEYSENLEADVSAWVATQPDYLQTAYKAVMQTGTSDEVADLIGRYRAATGTAPAAQAPAAPAAPAPAAGTPNPTATPKTELSSAAKQAAESLAPVSGDRSAVPQGEDTQDFDTAFSKYAAAGAGL